MKKKKKWELYANFNRPNMSLKMGGSLEGGKTTFLTFLLMNLQIKGGNVQVKPQSTFNTYGYQTRDLNKPF